jgi:hypothetical protein
MSLDTSINNVGEYYSSHYLINTFSKDIKPPGYNGFWGGDRAPPSDAEISKFCSQLL